MTSNASSTACQNHHSNDLQKRNTPTPFDCQKPVVRDYINLPLTSSKRSAAYAICTEAYHGQTHKVVLKLPFPD